MRTSRYDWIRREAAAYWACRERQEVLTERVCRTESGIAFHYRVKALGRKHARDERRSSTVLRPPRCVIWPNDTELRRADREVYADAVIKAGWRRAYERAPEERRDRALVLLASVLTEGEGREPVAA
jgi:hypothetical protein